MKANNKTCWLFLYPEGETPLMGGFSFLFLFEEKPMNTYAKLCPNVFVAKCPDAHQKGDIIILTSKYGKETEVEIHNLVKTSEDAYFYSFTRCDGVNSQVRAEKKAERYQNAASNALKRSEQYCEAANEGRELEKAKEKHQELKDKPELRTHAFSLTYAKKAVNELEKKVKLAELLWA